MATNLKDRIKNPVFTKDGRIDCEYNHPELGWIPLTSAKDDAETREIFLTAKELNPKPYVKPPIDMEQLAGEARAYRNQLLRESDFSQLPDAPTDKQAWQKFRQALRDIPTQKGFPQKITWPKMPE